MYLVTYKEFEEFLGNFEIPIVSELPTIVEFRDDNILKAKIELKSLNELKFAKSGNPIQKALNKYWIRGEEWN